MEEIHHLMASDGTVLAYRRWFRAEARAACLCLAGVESHGGWYEAGSSFLHEHGFNVYFLDRRGSGLSGGKRGHLSHIGEIYRDIDLMIRRMRRDLPERTPYPIFLLTLSWGAKVGLGFCLRYPRAVDALLCITPGWVSRVDVTFSEKLRMFISNLIKPDALFRVPIPDASFFTSDPAYRSFIENDPLRVTAITARFAMETHFLDRANAGSQHHRHQRLAHLPLGVFLSGKDPIIDNEGVTRMIRGLKTANTRIYYYGDACHTLEFDRERERYFKDLVSFPNLVLRERTGELPPLDYDVLAPHTRWLRNVLISPLINYLIPVPLIVGALKRSGSELAHENLTCAGGWRAMMIIYANRAPRDRIDRLVLTDGVIPMAVRNRRRLAVRKLVELFDRFDRFDHYQGTGSIHLLGIGAGTGIATIQAISYRKERAITAQLLDRDEAAFAAGEELKKAYEVEKQVQFLKADLAQLQDVILVRPGIVKLIGIIEHCSDDVLHHLLRTLSPFLSAGSVIIVNTTEDTHNLNPFLKRVFKLTLHYRSPSSLIKILNQYGYRNFTYEYEPLKMYSILIGYKGD
ncbi:MAG: alpha/beta fold hydrolase [Candidatus Omnitrophota bacterium]